MSSVEPMALLVGMAVGLGGLGLLGLVMMIRSSTRWVGVGTWFAAWWFVLGFFAAPLVLGAMKSQGWSG